MTTFYARRGNKILKISEDYVDRYLGQGYSITDMNGNLIKKGVPHDTNALTAEVSRQNEEIEKLKGELDTKEALIKEQGDEIEKLKSELNDATARLDKFMSKPISASDSEPVSAPKTTRKRKQSTEETTEA